MDFIKCLVSTVFLINAVTCQDVRRRINDNSIYSRTRNEEQNHKSRHLMFLEDLPAVWTEWSFQSHCSKSCGETGFLEAIRNCSSGNVKDCETIGGHYWQVRVCNNGPCVPMWTEWSSWATCSKSCGTGVSVRYRNCSTGTQTDCTGRNYELTACSRGSCSGFLTTTSTTTPAPIVAFWSSWNTEVPCSASCGPGFAEKVRTCSTGNNNNCAGKFWSVYACNLGDCLVDGVWRDWGMWSSCSVTCGGGQKTRSRSCDYPDPENPGEPCVGSDTQNLPCNQNTCPADGSWTLWSAWSQCSMTCDQGEQTRTRTCTFPDRVPHGNDCIGSRQETKICKEKDCAADGFWADWSSWSICTKTCDTGLRFRARVCLFETSRPHGADCSGPKMDRESCGITPCAVDGEWADWSYWTQCTHTCNGGKRSRSRVCTYATSTHRDPCAGDNREFQDCGLTPCPVDGVWGTWGPWGSCSKSCGGGSQYRNRTCQFVGPSPFTPHGKTCVGDGFKTQNCQTDPCPVDATWSIWSSYGPCNVSCGGGFRVKTRTCQYDPVAPMGKNCTGAAEFSQECNAQSCKVDGTLTAWEDWGYCSATCDGGTRKRTRHCYFPPNVPHGNPCTDPLQDTETCNVTPCPTTTTTTTEAPVDGHWSAYGPWSDCTATCDGGTHVRYRNCTYPEHHLHGTYCPGNDSQTGTCNTDHCPVDGQWSNWGLFGACSVSCAYGNRTRTRTCDFDPRYPRGNNCTGVTTNTNSCFAGACPVDGTWEEWAAWHACTVTCAGGTQERMRHCYFPTDAPHGGNCTGESHQSQPCNTEYCPVDGSLTEWSEWTNCTLSCGGGTHTRNRTCDFPPDRPRGTSCLGVLDQSQTCNNELCPVDGHWSEWKEWSNCDKTCEGGTQTRRRDCVFHDVAPHGDPCDGQMTEKMSCNEGTCPVDGHWAPWTLWTSCSVSCENGTHTRNRSCAFVSDAPRGNNCSGDASETEQCNNGLCPVNGVWLPWSTWTDCTVTCGNGTTTRNRSCDFPNGVPHGNNCTGPSTEMTFCASNICPIDGYFGGWSNWTDCSKTCENGTQQRTRLCIFDKVAPHGNNCSGVDTDTQTCNPQLCPVDGQWSEWSNFTECTVSCGNGTRVRTRKCEYRPFGHPMGNNCTGVDRETEICGTSLCPVDGRLSEWTGWTECTVTCGNGTQTRNRTCDFDPKFPHGKECTDKLSSMQTCNEERCPINGLWSPWSNFTECSVSCAGGTQSRNRTCVYEQDAPHGAQCFGNTTDVQNCKTEPCPVDGVWESWNEWHACDSSCGGGNRVRDRTCHYSTVAPRGQPCPGNFTHDIEECNPQACPVDGLWTDWSAWTPCSKSCGGGVRFHTRHCDFPADKPHGNNCTGTESERTTCNTTLCPVDGVWTQWASWSQCSVTCGGGSTLRNRTCQFNIDPSNPAPRGEECSGNDTETMSCQTENCPVDGEWGQWTDFSSCDRTCGNGTSSRSRTCEFAGSPRGKNCSGPGVETQVCNPNECPMDAVFTAWSTWTDCPVTCAGSNQTRDRKCEWPSMVHGKDCVGDTSESQECNKQLCPIDGVWSQWEPWGACSTTCDLGHKYRHRNCTFDDVAPHGITCIGKTDESAWCRTTLCKIDGQWSMWTSWSTCTVSCGEGNVTRTRLCAFAVPGAPHGKNCTGDNIEYQTCNNGTECPVDGEWSGWSSWSRCDVTCGHGHQQRTRTCVFVTGKPRGHDCPPDGGNQTQDCTQRDCPVDGVWLQWTSWSSCSQTCGGGTRDRHRDCYYQPRVPQGEPCLGSKFETSDCNNVTCPVDGVWQQWTSWSSCSQTCGGGTRDRHRDCYYQPHVPQGEPCLGSMLETSDCNNVTCPVDGVFTDWGTWSVCTATCGGGTQSRNRTCQFTPASAPVGKNCTGMWDETQNCGTEACATTTVTAPTTPAATTTTSSIITTTVATTTTTETSTTNVVTTAMEDTTSQTTSTTPLPSTTLPTTVPTTVTETTAMPTTTVPTIETTTMPIVTEPIPTKARSCFQCLGPTNLCEKLNAPLECPMEKQYCINTLDNKEDASRVVDMRCGTRQECESGWFTKYSSNDRCTRFDQDFVYTNKIYCEFCCHEDDCNAKINPDNKWKP